MMKPAFALIACLAAAPAVAAETAMSMTYGLFETAIAHTDLDSCPAQLAKPDTFCRATLRHDEIHVFAFSRDGESPLVGFASYSFDELARHLK
ncbi:MULTISPECIES: hypothetical protein [unclassified Leisingera]|uniref:hypothetical protein n=2 Tax=Leisingera TaxID=191028 RepID=UPI00030FED78|nr:MULTISPECIES: hypothetical protein [unclassified Leisingera]KIC26544.1 hypothetical protein RA23_02045 [Leisingera sp. ANG-S3]KIC27199.1 hypothetical protein RA24_15130 [Leisingera sp. ANG-M6]KIC53772.1 hypothetical protein RA22_08630 [Leisingera sp. ANG-S]KID10260.1 hypothetical protein GC1_00750 [Leisingera sp. ANG1]